MSTTSVLLIDDDANILRMLTRYLETAPDLTVCGAGTDADTAITLTRTLLPRIVIIDWHRSGRTTAHLIPALLDASPQTRIIVFTSDSTARRTALSLQGVVACVIKGTPVADLVQVIRGSIAQA